MNCLHPQNGTVLTEIKVVVVHEEVRKVEELGDELSDVGHVGLAGGTPGVGDAVE